MGGGPSTEEKRAAEQAERRAQEQAAIQTRLVEAATKPDPLEELTKAQGMDWLRWSAGENGPVDVRRAPSLGPSLSLYDSAARGQQGERMGIGALGMGAQGANADLANLLKEQHVARREQEAAGGLERAVAYKDAEVKGSVMPLLGLGQNRTMGLASLGSSNANTAQGQQLSFLANRPQRNSFWRTFSQTLGGTLGRTLGGGNASGSGFFGTGG